MDLKNDNVNADLFFLFDFINQVILVAFLIASPRSTFFCLHEIKKWEIMIDAVQVYEMVGLTWGHIKPCTLFW